MSIMDCLWKRPGYCSKRRVIIWRIKTPMEAERRCTAI
jgi:hypothetical protein